MLISYHWLKKHIFLNESPEEVSKILTHSGLEVEKLHTYESIKGSLNGLVIGHVLTCEKHPGADKLSKTTVSVGNNSILPIVCGASNIAAGQKVIVAKVGATLYPSEGESFQIKQAKIRGEVSEGMICAEDEIGLGKSHNGIIVLDTELPEGTPASVFYNVQSDTIFEIGLTPNRADAASHRGVARDLKVLLKRDLIQRPIKTREVKAASDINVEIENTIACPRYCGAVIKNIKVSPSPQWLQSALKSIGIGSINNVVDATNYILHDTGQPLHAFDMSKIKSSKIIIKNADENSTIVTLDGVERKLSTQDLVISNEIEPMAIAGVFGGKKTGVTNDTHAIFLESAYFNPDFIRRTSLHHGLKTDATFRYERGADPNICVDALLQAIDLISEVAGGTLESEIIDIYPVPVKHHEISISYDYIQKLIGIALPKPFILETLEKLEIKVVQQTETSLLLEVSPYRVDVKRPADIVEELLRIYGYDNVHLSHNIYAGFASPSQNNAQSIQQIISTYLSSNSYYEIITNSLTSSKYSQAINLQQSDVQILNPLSEPLNVLRQSTLFSGLEVIAYNINRKQKDLFLYEFGKTYSLLENTYLENNRLSVFCTGASPAESWMQESKPVSFFNLKTTVQGIFSKVGIKNINYEEINNEIFNYGLEIKIGQKSLGKFGLLHPSICLLADVKQEVYFADIDFDLLINKKHDKQYYSEISKFPEVRRDLSLLLPKAVTFDQIYKVARSTEKKLIQQINVFDVYEGKGIDENKKSYSVSFSLGDRNQTLTDAIVDKTMSLLADNFEKQLGATIRK